MEKVKITREQAEAIEKIKDIDYAINIHSFKKRPDSPLVDMSTARLARALFVGYEVEPEFEIGDFIEIELFGRGVVVEITGINNADGRIRINGSSEFNEYNVIRKLTDEEIKQEKERRWWASHNRDVWELREGDMLIDNFGNVHEVTQVPDDFGNRYYLDYVSSNFVEIKQKYKVLIFAENRLDVTSDV